MTQTFNQDVLVDGAQDVQQLRVQGHTQQNEPLQTWEDSAGSPLAQVTGDGRLQIGDDLGLATPDALLEAHRAETSIKPPRGLHSLGRVSGTLNNFVQWMVGELELRGSSAIDALHTALRIRASNMNTGTPTPNAELRGADVEVINDASAGATALPKATGLQVGVTNGAGKTIEEAVGLRVKMTNGGTISYPYSIYADGPGVAHFEDYLEVKTPPVDRGKPTTNFIRIYATPEGRLHAKNWVGQDGEDFDLMDGGVHTHDTDDITSGVLTPVRLPVMVGATASEAGESGILPAPAAGDQEAFFRGDGQWAAVEDSLWAEIASWTVLDMAAGSIDLTNIPQDYQHLVLWVSLLSSRTSSWGDTGCLRFNGDTGNQYSYAATYLSPAGTVYYGNNLVGYLSLPGYIPTSQGGNTYSRYVAQIVISEYKQTGMYRHVHYTGYAQATSTGHPSLSGGGVWTNTANAINQITLSPATGPNWVAGSAYALYGIKG